MSFCWNRHHISLTNAEVAHNAFSCWIKSRFTHARVSPFRFSLSASKKKPTWKNLPFFLFFWEERKRVEADIVLQEPERSSEELHVSFSAFCVVLIVEFSVFGGTLAADVTAVTPPPLPSFHNYTF